MFIQNIYKEKKMKKMYSYKDLSIFFNLSTSYISYLVKKYNIDSIKIGTCKYINKNQLKTFYNNRFGKYRSYSCVDEMEKNI